MENETISLLKMSKATIGDQGNTQLALVLILSNIENKDLESIKNSLYSLYTDVKLQKCAPNLPEGFFPNYTNVKEYGKILRDLKSSKSSSSVEKHASTNKRHIILIKVRILSILMRVLPTKILTTRQSWRTKRRTKAWRIQRKRHAGRVKRKRLRKFDIDAVHVVSIDGGTIRGMRILCGRI